MSIEIQQHPMPSPKFHKTMIRKKIQIFEENTHSKGRGMEVLPYCTSRYEKQV
jgi:hypothetical protein